MKTRNGISGWTYLLSSSFRPWSGHEEKISRVRLAVLCSNGSRGGSTEVAIILILFWIFEEAHDCLDLFVWPFCLLLIVQIYIDEVQ